MANDMMFKSLFVQAKGELKRQLCAYLKRSPAEGLKTLSTAQSNCGQRMKEAICVRECPASSEDQALPGHWEGNLLLGARQSQIAILVERSTRFMILARVKDADMQSVTASIVQQAKRLPSVLQKSLLQRDGLDRSKSKHFSVAADVALYFCAPQSPWKRGEKENTSGLLRQYFPEHHDLCAFSQTSLDQVAAQLNQRARKTLAWQTPAESLLKALGSPDGSHVVSS